ncbi:MAG: 1-deoxy-D-xylulose-5-phosphate synthase [Candidatus Omnitrophica bacterium]|nr:1-deoxy-D-xylulose-5-phosphate synthase [Candidatus Omnitrophota bacterium]MCM8831892.1 1-deoxy-D-xylulose-5-phosphate synthase [Candidatus Omnitrophota bacterium]
MLEKINSPKDLKKLDIKKLKILSEEIRNLIIEIVSQKGGHLASSLGCVELCIALHYCFDTPTDTIIFDVGHQTYAHKILTGRKDKFYKLREYNGISGFPNPAESIYDVYISGHASTAVSWAQGIAEAKRLKKDNSKTIAVIGDGSLTGGLCFEALNCCGHMQSEVLVILNHNDLSISPSVGALSNYLNKIISAPIYNRIKSELEKFLKNFSLVKKLAPKVKKFEEAIKGLIVPGIFFEELGFRYFGPIDGHNLDILIPALKNISFLKGPRLLHIITKKGKGYKFAESNPQDFHSAVSFNIKNGLPIKEQKETFSQVFGKKLTELANKDTRIVAITAAMPKGTGLDLFKTNFPERFFDVGIAEEHSVSLASGLAKEGLKPVVAIYSTFLQRSFDQIIHDVALQNLGVVFAIDRAGLVGEDGPTHHGVFDIGYTRLIPNLVCMAAKDKEELEDMLEFALKLNLPVSIRYPKDYAYSLNKREKIELGKSQILNEGDDICIIAVGSLVKVAYEVLNLIRDFGISAFLVNARFIKPLDDELLIYIAKRFNIIFTIEEGNLNCGFGSAVLEFYEKEGLLGKIRLIRLGLPDEFIPAGKREELLKMYGLDAKRISERIKKTIYKENFLWQRL